MSEDHSGFTLLGNIDGNSDTYKAENMLDPSAAQDYVTKNYMESKAPTSTNRADIKGINLTGGNGTANRTYDFGRTPIMIFVEGLLLHTDLYSVASNIITFKQRIFNQQKITIW